MKFLFISGKGRAAPIAYRMQEEGTDVAFYIHDPRYTGVYEGILKERIMEPAGLGELILNTEDMDGLTIIFDGTMPLEPEAGHEALRHRDQAVLDLRQVKEPTVGRLFGPWSSELQRAGFNVIGSSATTEKAQLNRDAGRKLGMQVGMSQPPSQNCSNRSNLLSFLAAHKQELWTIHPINPCATPVRWVESRGGELLDMLQGPWGKRFPEDLPVTLTGYIPGLTYHEGAWWNGKEFTCIHSMIEDRFTGSVSRGHLVDSMLTLTWMQSIPRVPWEALKGWLGTALYLGPIHARVQINPEGKACHTGWTFGFSYDSIYGFLSLLFGGGVTRFFLEGFRSGVEDDCLAATTRAYMHPYPAGTQKECEELIQSTKIGSGYSLKDFWGVDVRARHMGLEVAGTDGLVGVGVYRDNGHDIEEMFDAAQRRIAGVASGIEFKGDLAGVKKSWERADKLRLTSELY